MNVNIEDIKEIEKKLNITLTKEERNNVLREYNRVCMDKGESWSIIIKELIKTR